MTTMTMISSTEAFDKLMKARCRLLTVSQWYGTMCSLMDWKIEDNIKTAGVRAKRNGRIECSFSSNFLYSLFPEKCICAPNIDIENACVFCKGYKIDTIIGVLIHELDHVIKLHCARRGGKNPKVWNYATDMHINGKESERNIQSLIDIPILNNDGLHIGYNKIIYMHPELNMRMTSEEIYQWLLKNNPETHGILVDNHDIWQESELDYDQTRQIISGICGQISKITGNIPGHLKDDISQLSTPTVDWRFITKNYIGRRAGGKRSTYLRRSKRFDLFGWPGITNRNRSKATVSVDVSGSVSIKLLERFFSEIERLSNLIDITLVQFDTNIRSVLQYRRGDWKNIKINGRGGTSFINLVKELKEKNLLDSINIVITDGEATFPEDNLDILWVSNKHINPQHGTVIHIPIS